MMSFDLKCGTCGNVMDEKLIKTCVWCEEWTCIDCIIDIDGIYYCFHCWQKERDELSG